MIRSCRPVLVLLVLLTAAAGWAEDNACDVTIGALPFTINTRGSYCLAGSLDTAGDGVWIQAADVTLDLKGYQITGPGSGFGVLIFRTASNAIVRNGAIRSFDRAVRVDGLSTGPAASGVVIEELRISDVRQGGISVLGAGADVRRNTIGPVGVGATGQCDGVFALRADGGRVADNLVFDVACAFPSGIVVGGGDQNGVVVEHNQVVGSTARLGDGIHVDGRRSTIADNRVRSFTRCVAVGTLEVKMRDNLTTDCSQPYVGGIDAGNNQ
jgi:hypothetical protein